MAKDFYNAEKYYLMAIKREHINAMINLGVLYQTEFKDFQKAEKYYLMAVEKKHTDAMHNLGLLYQSEFKDFQKAEKYKRFEDDKQMVLILFSFRALILMPRIFQSQRVKAEHFL